MLTKTDYIIWRNCHKNAWLKVHKPAIYHEHELSDFEKQIIETGNEVDLLARELFPTGEYQKKFSAKEGGSASPNGGEKDGFLAITDILVGNNLYEVKATNDIDKKTHYHDLAFQYNVLKLSGLHLESANLIHLNPEYVRKGEIELNKLFVIENVTEKIIEMADEVLEEMKLAKEYLENETEPKGPCDCIYRGRSSQCTTFAYSNPDIPKYGVHDLTRIGTSKKKLIELVDGHKFNLEDIPESLELSDAQKNQIWTHLHDREIISRADITDEFERLEFPLYFLDYETFPAAIPRFDDFSPYNQIPFQYSLHVQHRVLDKKPEHKDFLYTESGDPSEAFAQSLQDSLGDKGSVIVWHKDFECGRNRELGQRLPEFKNFFEEVEKRIFDLEDIFKKQYHVHPAYKGKTSIKKVLPVLVPSLKYDGLEIAEGGTAAEKWNQLTTDNRQLTAKEKETIIQNLKDYCKLDTYAMYAIWKALYSLIS